MELTPRTQPDVKSSGSPSAAPVRSRRRLLGIALVLVVLVALVIVVFKALSDATTYFLNADEAVEQQSTLGESRFRLQGMVLEGATEHEGGAAFEVVHNCAVVGVQHTGDPPQMFSPGIPVVLEGSWDSSGDHFASDTMFVAHDAEYQEEDGYEERIEESEAGGAYETDDCPEVAGG